jgi:hypothetical protein
MQATLSLSFLRIPPIAFLFRELHFRCAAWFSQEQHFEVAQAESGGISLIVVARA